MNGERILITGGFGYVGGRLALHLTRAADKQIALGTRSPGPSPDWLRTAAVVETPWHSDQALDRACKSMDAVIHVAGMNAQECTADPVGALEMNGVATARLLRSAIRCGVKRFIYVSTAHVYGPLRGSITEDTCAVSLHPYATSHRAGEDAVLFAHEQQAIQGVAIRLSNSFGPPTHGGVNCWALLVNDLCRQAVRTKRLVLRSSGTQRRDFITLTDACRGIAHLLDIGSERLGNGLYNLGGKWSPTVIQMTERIATCCQKLFGHRPEIVRPRTGLDEDAEDVDYRIDKLSSSGFTLTRDVDAEIIGTLNFCATQ